MVPSSLTREMQPVVGPLVERNAKKHPAPGLEHSLHSEKALRKSGMCSITLSEITTSKLSSAKLRAVRSS